MVKYPKNSGRAIADIVATKYMAGIMFIKSLSMDSQNGMLILGLKTERRDMVISAVFGTVERDRCFLKKAEVAVAVGNTLQSYCRKVSDGCAVAVFVYSL